MLHNLTVYDGLYLVLAAGNDCRLVTANGDFAKPERGGVIRNLVAWVSEVR